MKLSKLSGCGLLFAALLAIGCTETLPTADHDHDHGDAHGHDHTPHHGIVVPLESGFAELKLHDDKGDLELWLTRDEAGSKPLDLPLDAEISVTFPDLDQKQVSLQVRNREKNEDEDGKANLRSGKTNYFIFPGDTGADASFLLGKDFVSEAVIKVSADGKTYETAPFELRPHTH